MTTSIIDVCHHVIELEKNSTPSPWKFYQLVDNIDARALIDSRGYLFGRCDDIQNGELIAYYRNNTPAIARRLIECEAQLTIAKETLLYYGKFDGMSGPQERAFEKMKAMKK